MGDAGKMLRLAEPERVRGERHSVEIYGRSREI